MIIFLLYRCWEGRSEKSGLVCQESLFGGVEPIVSGSLFQMEVRIQIRSGIFLTRDYGLPTQTHQANCSSS